MISPARHTYGAFVIGTELAKGENKRNPLLVPFDCSPLKVSMSRRQLSTATRPSRDCCVN
jgi:hypothetical protein